MHTTPRYKTICEIAEREAREMGCDYVGVEHLMLAIAIEGGSIPAMILDESGVDLGKVCTLIRSRIPESQRTNSSTPTIIEDS